MTIQITRWSPDTCGCVLEYSWDDTVPQEDRIHTFHNIVGKCKDHPNLNGVDVFTHVLENNQRKNKVHGWILDNLPNITKTIPGGGKSLMDGIEFIHSYSGLDKNRVLKVQLKGIELTKEEKKRIKDFGDGSFGKDMVIVE